MTAKPVTVVPSVVVPVGVEALSRLMPMFLWLGPDGVIRAAGPTLAKAAAEPLVEQVFFDAFKVRWPHDATDVADLAASGGQVQIIARDTPARVLRGTAVALAGGQGVLLNLSFGIAVADAVRDLGLTQRDFAPTDLAVEMLYVMEAKTAVLDELRALNERLQGARQQAETEALTDTLTGLGNRRALDRALATAAASGQPFAVLHIDLDLFKQVNDSFGHDAGDHVLREVARLLRMSIRDSDIAARVGGDEFVLLLPGFSEPERVIQIAERILAAARAPIPYEGRFCNISASIGMVLSADYARPDPAQMLRDADRALYASKRAGRGQTTLLRAPHRQGGIA